MKTWIFQGNPTRFNVNDYLLENEYIWWSIRQAHLAEHIKLGDEVFIWRSDGANKGSGGIVARTEVTSLPQDYTNDNESSAYWYEDVSGDTYLAVELKVLEIEIEKLLKRTVLLQDTVLKELPILKLRQNTNYLLENEVGVNLKNAWIELGSKDIKANNFSKEKSTDWQLELVETLKELGGSGTLKDIYLTIQARDKINLKSYVDWKSPIRKQLYLCSSDCDIFKGEPGVKTDLFYSIVGKGKGYWGLRNFSPSENNVSLIEDDLSFVEGKRKLRTHLIRERNPKIIKLAKERFKEKHGRLFCEVCDFDFFDKYGELGEDFIEGHHTIPVSELVEGQNTNVEDIALVCSNCHKMLHRRRPWLNKMELKEIIR